MENVEELKALKQENSKLKLEARLRKSLASELERQKTLVQEAKVEADAQRDKLQKASEQLSKYLSPQICEKIFSGAEFSAKSSRKKLTIFFSDIVGFTTISEQMEAEDLSNFLNFYLTNMCDIALKYGGTIDKFIGDSVMVFLVILKQTALKKMQRHVVIWLWRCSPSLRTISNMFRKCIIFPKSSRCVLGSTMDFATLVILVVRNALTTLLLVGLLTSHLD